MRAYIWPLAGVDSSTMFQSLSRDELPMTRERATVAKGLLTLTTCVRSLPCVYASMYSQSGSLNELFSTFIALIWPIRD